MLVSKSNLHVLTWQTYSNRDSFFCSIIFKHRARSDSLDMNLFKCSLPMWRKNKAKSSHDWLNKKFSYLLPSLSNNEQQKAQFSWWLKFFTSRCAGREPCSKLFSFHLSNLQDCYRITTLLPALMAWSRYMMSWILSNCLCCDIENAM